ncbi:MAG: Folylpolyglutamate synthase [candidate division TM6 bacterium GW2011_GWF2_37_49]|nr:MAG: Folylpolyglutamate synthase [candidate division TM6 bacterium GW2011_GWF2_37_49]
MLINKQVQKKGVTSLDKIRSYNEVIEYLDSLTYAEYNESVLERMSAMNSLFDNVANKVDTILVSGTNGKSLTMHFAAKLLKEEDFKVGLAYSSNILTYNEHIVTDTQSISNKIFADILNEVINTAESNNIKATAYELLTIASLINFINEKVDVAILEVRYGGKYDATNICNPKIAALTRVAQDSAGLLNNDLDQVAFEMLETAKSGSWFISAEQSKIRLQKMKTVAIERGIEWAMPIRKLASLPYIYEQLFGRVASLGERIAQIYVEDIKGKFSPFLRGNLLITQKGQRGRPTLEAKRQSELNPVKTLKSFWADQFDLIRGRFELIDKENPSILLDNASNLDALTNLYLGIRLMHYKKPLKGLAIIIGFSKTLDAVECCKLIRYLTKKVNGSAFFVRLPGEIESHSPEELANIAKELNLKAKACSSLSEALDVAKGAIDGRDGLIAITGSQNIVTEFWKLRGIKKF